MGTSAPLEPPSFTETLNHILAERDKEASRPSLGSSKRPYELVVPGWLEDRCIEQGTTAQAEADKLFRYATRVTVVR